MLYKIQHLVKIVIHWKEEEEEEADAFNEWKRKMKIYPASSGGNGGSWDKNQYHYSRGDAKLIEAYFKTRPNMKKCQILPS